MGKIKWLINYNSIDNSREEVINFLETIEMLSDANYDVKQNETKGKDLKY